MDPLETSQDNLLQTKLLFEFFVQLDECQILPLSRISERRQNIPSLCKEILTLLTNLSENISKPSLSKLLSNPISSILPKTSLCLCKYCINPRYYSPIFIISQKLLSYFNLNTEEDIQKRSDGYKMVHHVKWLPSKKEKASKSSTSREESFELSIPYFFRQCA